MKEKAINYIFKDIDEAVVKVKRLLQKISIPKILWIRFLDKIKTEQQKYQLLVIVLVCHLFGKERILLDQEDSDLYASEVIKLFDIFGNIVSSFHIAILINEGKIAPTFNKNGELLLSLPDKLKR